ncbi:MAG: nucleotidyl transferase AbiEii/AbiGii toxin family protein [Candidatus Rokubacteria bacterium]|nr:nucleotidyl transferase AbiEii/AbiGii toxin family protein [Candidatus Rokubacteria bacterium]
MTLEGLNEDFRDLLVLFADAGVEFVVVGAYALAFHGAPRASGDIDLFVRPSRENAHRVLDALARFGAPLSSARVTVEDLAQGGSVYQIGLPPRRIDILTEISGVSFDEAWASRVAGDLDGREVSFIGRSELLRNKEAAGRLQDLADVERLRRTPPRP